MLWLVVGFGILVFIFAGFRVVQEQERWVIERWGKFHRVLHRGLNWVFPILDKVRAVVSLSEQSIALFKERPSVDFKEGGTAVLVEPRIWVRPKGAVEKNEAEIDESVRRMIYEVEDWKDAIKESVENSLTARFGSLSVDDAIEERSALGDDGWWKAVKEKTPGLEVTIGGWGLSVTRITISDFEWSEEVVATRRSIYEKLMSIRTADLGVQVAKFEAVIKAFESGGMHGEIVQILTASPYNFSREEAERVASDYVTYFKGADTGRIIDWRGGEGDISSLFAKIIAGVDFARESLKGKPETSGGSKAEAKKKKK